MTSTLVEHFFRHEYGRLVAQLARRVGLRHLELVEDAVQGALAAALDTWGGHGTPHEPSAWLFRVAHNNVISALRQDANRSRILDANPGVDVSAESAARLASEVHDDLLRMLFACCRDVIPEESRIVIALKTLCGFSTDEIAHRLFTTEASVHKRLQRARIALRDLGELEPTHDEMSAMLPSVHHVVYLVFNEGYLSLRADAAIRTELTDEAIRLATLLAEHPLGARPETFALLALMHLHAARSSSRTDASGGLLLLEEQDRSQWRPDQIERGLTWLARSADGATFSRYHAEAGIAAEHSIAPSFAETNWSAIVELYRLLDRVAPSPLNALNRAVAVAEWRGAEVALAELDAIAPPRWLEQSYLRDAVYADLLRRTGRPFSEHRVRAIAGAPTEVIRAVLQRRL
ncbi:MAG TPA: sigma-70 family RNA polymerase sigma factor [Kofleriaceae bacterium]